MKNPWNMAIREKNGLENGPFLLHGILVFDFSIENGVFYHPFLMQRNFESPCIHLRKNIDNNYLILLRNWFII